MSQVRLFVKKGLGRVSVRHRPDHIHSLLNPRADTLRKGLQEHVIKLVRQMQSIFRAGDTLPTYESTPGLTPALPHLTSAHAAVHITGELGAAAGKCVHSFMQTCPSHGIKTPSMARPGLSKLTWYIVKIVMLQDLAAAWPCRIFLGHQSTCNV